MEIRDIEKRIAELKGELAEVHGTQTEVYTRIVGYYRSVKNWNAGKREEYGQRKLFEVPEGEADPVEVAQADAARHDKMVEIPQGAQKPLNTEEEPTAYLLFTRQTCPNCPPVINFVSGLDMNGTKLDVDTEEGLEAARKYGVMASPTVIFLDQGKKEIFRANNVGDLKAKIPLRV